MMTPALLFLTFAPHQEYHDDIPCFRHNENSNTESLENPLKNIQVSTSCRLFFLCHKLDQLITHYNVRITRRLNDHRFREVSDHRKTPLFHASGVCPTSPAISPTGIDRIEHAPTGFRDSLDERPSEPFIEFVEYAAHKRSPPDDQPNSTESRGTRVMPMRRHRRQYQLFHTLAFEAGCLTVTLQKVDNAPDTKTCAQYYEECKTPTALLKNSIK